MSNLHKGCDGARWRFKASRSKSSGTELVSWDNLKSYRHRYQLGLRMNTLLFNVRA